MSETEIKEDQNYLQESSKLLISSKIEELQQEISILEQDSEQQQSKIDKKKQKLQEFQEDLNEIEIKDELNTSQQNQLQKSTEHQEIQKVGSTLLESEDIQIEQHDGNNEGQLENTYEKQNTEEIQQENKQEEVNLTDNNDINNEQNSQVPEQEYGKVEPENQKSYHTGDKDAKRKLDIQKGIYNSPYVKGAQRAKKIIRIQNGKSYYVEGARNARKVIVLRQNSVYYKGAVKAKGILFKKRIERNNNSYYVQGARRANKLLRKNHEKIQNQQLANKKLHPFILGAKKVNQKRLSQISELNIQENEQTGDILKEAKEQVQDQNQEKLIEGDKNAQKQIENNHQKLNQKRHDSTLLHQPYVTNVQSEQLEQINDQNSDVSEDSNQREKDDVQELNQKQLNQKPSGKIFQFLKSSGSLIYIKFEKDSKSLGKSIQNHNNADKQQNLEFDHNQDSIQYQSIEPIEKKQRKSLNHDSNIPILNKHKKMSLDGKLPSQESNTRLKTDETTVSKQWRNKSNMVLPKGKKEGIQVQLAKERRLNLEQRLIELEQEIERLLKESKEVKQVEDEAKLAHYKLFKYRSKFQEEHNDPERQLHRLHSKKSQLNGRLEDLNKEIGKMESKDLENNSQIHHHFRSPSDILHIQHHSPIVKKNTLVERDRIQNDQEAQKRALELIQRMQKDKKQMEERKNHYQEKVDHKQQEVLQQKQQQEEEIVTHTQQEKREHISKRLEEQKWRREQRIKLQQQQNQLVRQLNQEQDNAQIEFGKLEEKKKELRSKRFTYKLQNQSMSSEQPRYISKVHLLHLEEERKRKLELDEQDKLKQQNQQKKSSYAKIVKEMFKPKISDKLRIEIERKKHNKSVIITKNSLSPMKMSYNRDHRSSTSQQSSLINNINHHKSQDPSNDVGSTPTNIHSNLNSSQMQRTEQQAYTETTHSKQQNTPGKLFVKHKNKSFGNMNQGRNIMRRQSPNKLQTKEQEQSRPKIDYLQQVRENRQELEKQGKLVIKDQWKKQINFKNPQQKQEYVMSIASRLEQEAEQKEIRAKQTKNADMDGQVNQLLIQAIRAKVSLLKEQQQNFQSNNSQVNESQLSNN